MKTVRILTYGCSMNKADSEIMAGLLEKEKNFHVIIADGNDKGDGEDILIINTCSVKTPTERKILRRLKEVEKENTKKVIVTGCLPASQPEISREFEKFSFLGVNVEDTVGAVENVEKGERFLKISSESKINKKTLLQKIRENKIREIIPIAKGCIGECSYCITKVARGKLKSFSPELILNLAKNSISSGVKEIFLTAQDTGAYGLDFSDETNLPFLIKKVSNISGKFFIRVGMMNPNHALKFLDELIFSYKNEKVYKFLHIPVQSGDNDILRKMNRKYGVEDFKKVVEKFRREIPEITISTDVIVGFPTENEEQFFNTLDLIKKIKPDVLNISRYWQRPKTSASRIKELHGRETKRRSRILAELFKKIALEKNKKWIGWEGEALVSEYNRNTKTYTGRNFAYKPIILKSEKNLLGKFIRVKIKDATYYDLRGEIII